MNNDWIMGVIGYGCIAAFCFDNFGIGVIFYSLSICLWFFALLKFHAMRTRTKK